MPAVTLKENNQKQSHTMELILCSILGIPLDGPKAPAILAREALPVPLHGKIQARIVMDAEQLPFGEQ